MTTPKSSREYAAAKGLVTPQGYDQIRDGDDAITTNARFLADQIDQTESLAQRVATFVPTGGTVGQTIIRTEDGTTWGTALVGVPIFSSRLEAAAWAQKNPGQPYLWYSADGTTDPGGEGPSPSAIIAADTFTTAGRFFGDSAGGVHPTLRQTEVGSLTWQSPDKGGLAGQNMQSFQLSTVSGGKVVGDGDGSKAVIQLPTAQVKVTVDYALTSSTAHFFVLIGGVLFHVDPGGTRYRVMNPAATNVLHSVSAASTPVGSLRTSGTLTLEFSAGTLVAMIDGALVLSYASTQTVTTWVGFVIRGGGTVDNFTVERL